MSDLSKYKVPVGQLRWSCKKGTGGVCGTDDTEATGEIIGQDRAIDAIKLGLNVEQPGYNVFLVGYAGTGRSTAIQKMLEELGLKKGQAPEDICYVNNLVVATRSRSLQSKLNPTSSNLELTRDGAILP